MEVPTKTEEELAWLFLELGKAQARLSELEVGDTIIVRPHEELMIEAKQRHGEKVTVWEEIYRENVDPLINDLKVAKAKSIKISVYRS